MAVVSNELTILNELAKVVATQHEWLAIADILNQLIRDAEFIEQYQRMGAELAQCYRFIENLFAPFVALTTQEKFEQAFVQLHDDYQKNYLLAASKPRHAADRSYEVCLGLLQRKESKTSYPLLKRTFDRLDYFVDKYVTNDTWLVMSIETVLKRLSRFLNEVADLYKGDREEAFLVYRALMIGIERFISLIVGNLARG